MKPPDVKTMVSYRKSDTDFVDELLEYLAKRGVTPWIDRDGIAPGMRWRDELFNQLQHCDACIVVVSSEYLESEYCRMEAFVARSFGRRILPVMIDDCFDLLRDQEETRGLEDIFMMRMFRLNAVGLKITQSQAFDRVVRAISTLSDTNPTSNPVYISYSRNRDGKFATAIAKRLRAEGVEPWVATQNVNVGENWRDAQVRAMMRASTHVIVLDEKIIRSPVLRTEILLSEARGLMVLTVLPPRLNGKTELINGMIDDLNHGDQTYRRLTELQYFTDKSIDLLAQSLAKT